MLLGPAPSQGAGPLRSAPDVDMLKLFTKGAACRLELLPLPCRNAAAAQREDSIWVRQQQQLPRSLSPALTLLDLACCHTWHKLPHAPSAHPQACTPSDNTHLERLTQPHELVCVCLAQRLVVGEGEVAERVNPWRQQVIGACAATAAV